MVVEQAWDKGWAYATLGDFELRNGYYKDAVNSFIMAIHDNREDDALLHTKLAQAYMKVGDIEGARTVFEKAYQLPSASYYTFAEYAGFLFQLGDFANAVEMYKTALTRRPNDPSVLLNLGQTYESMNEMDNAASLYRYIINNRENFADEELLIAQDRLQALDVSP
jgi:tetratricopeptide (TPR) repeat protein